MSANEPSPAPSNATLEDAAAFARIPGSRVTLGWPRRFQLATNFTGLMQQSSGASIVINEISGSAQKVLRGMTKEAMQERAGVTVRERTPVTVDGRDAVLFDAQQPVAGAMFRKWLLLFGDDETTVQVVATYPAGAGDELSETLRDALLSVQWDPDREVPRYEGVPYRIREQPPLRYAGRMGTNLSFNTSGRTPARDPLEPFLTVAPSLAGGATLDGKGLARRLLLTTALATQIDVTSSEAVTIGGLQAYETIASAADQETGQPIVLYQLLVLPNEGGYFRLLGMVRREERKLLDVFQAMGRTFRVQP